MRRGWQTSVVTALCGVVILAAQAAGSPSGMMGGRTSTPQANAFAGSTTASSGSSSWSAWSPGTWKFWGKEKPSDKPTFYHQATAAPVPPSKSISPWRNPVRYFSAAMSETPIAQSLSSDGKEVPKSPSDSIALDKPVGPPTQQSMIAFAQLAEGQGNVELARSYFRQALTKWPDDVEVLRATARLEDRQGQMVVAENLYRRAVTVNPQHAGAYNDLGLCLARQGKLEPSVQAIEQAICLQPDKALYRNNVATVLVELQQDQKALAHLSAVHGGAASNYNLGQLLVARGRSQQAVPYFQAAVELDPTMDAARVALAQASGTPMVPSQVAGEVTPVMPTTVAPSYGPQLAPQQSAQQPVFPATARGPAWNSSTAVPQGASPTIGGAVQVGGSQGGPMYQAAAPRYLPPVQTPAGTAVR